MVRLMPAGRAISHRQAKRSAQPAAGLDLFLAGISLLERVSPIEWHNVVLSGQYILTGSSDSIISELAQPENE